jgi:hypothetical protein
MTYRERAAAAADLLQSAWVGRAALLEAVGTHVGKAPVPKKAVIWLPLMGAVMVGLQAALCSKQATVKKIVGRLLIRDHAAVVLNLS